MGRMKLVDPNPKGQDVINHEDLSIFVELVTTKKDRSAINRDDSEKVTGFQKGGTKIPIKFLKGTDTDGDGRNELTTHYTEINTKFNQANPDLETLGITSIDIDFNTSYAPMVTIDFTDIRGKLFEMGNESPYSVFFNMPYPIFELTIKGYYGKAVKYCLHLTKFSGKLNDTTGNFEIQCDFIGYTYAFLADMLMGYLRGIAETDIARDKIAAAKVKFASYDPPQAFFGMNEFNEKIKTLNTEIEKLKHSDERIQQLAKSEAGIIKVDALKEDIRKFLRNIGNERDVTTNESMNLLYKGGFVMFRKPTNKINLDNITRAITQDFNKLFVDKVIAFNTEYPEFSVNSDSYRIEAGKNSDYEIRRIDFTSAIEIGQYISNNGKTFTTEDSFGNPVIYQLRTVRSISEKSAEYYEDFRFDIELLGSKIADSTELGYIDLRYALDELNDVGVRLTNYSKKTKELLSNELVDKIETIFQVTTLDENGNPVTIKFSPTIKNMVRLLTEHVHIFMKCIKEVAGEVQQNISDKVRKSQFRNLTTDRVYELKDGGTDSDDTGDINEVLPFPDYKEKNYDKSSGGFGAYEDKWIGTKAPSMPEVDFIEQLLEGLINAKKKDNELLEALEYGEEFWFPINPFDTTIMTGFVNPWAAFKNSNDPDEIIRHMLLRATIALGYSYHAGLSETEGFTLDEVKAIAKLEANNAFNNIDTVAIRHNIAYNYGGDANSMANDILTKAGYTTTSTGYDKWINNASFFNKNKIFGSYTFEQASVSNILFDIAIIAVSLPLGLVGLTGPELENTYGQTTLVDYKYIPALSPANDNAIVSSPIFGSQVVWYLPLSSAENDKTFFTGNKLITKDGLPATLDSANYANNSDRIALRDNGYVFFGSYLGGNTTAGKAKPDDGATTVRIIKNQDYNPPNGRFPDYSEAILETIPVKDNVIDLTNISDLITNFSLYSSMFGGAWKTHEFFYAKMPEGKYIGNSEVAPVELLFYSNTSSDRPCFGAARSINADLSEQPSIYDIKKVNGVYQNMNGVAFGVSQQRNLFEEHRKDEYWGSTKRVLSDYRDGVRNVACTYLGFELYNQSSATGTEDALTRNTTHIFPIFGSDLYYQQLDDKAKAFLFLHSIPFDGLSYDIDGWWGLYGNSWEGLFSIFDEVAGPDEEVDSGTGQASRGTGLFTKTIQLFFTQRAGFIKTPYPWILFVGALLWRYRSATDPLKWVSDSGYSLIPNAEGQIPPTKAEYLLPNVATNEIMGFVVDRDALNDLFDPINGPINLIFEGKRKYIPLERTLTRLPDSVAKVFIDEFLAWTEGVNGNESKFRLLANKLEIFKPNVTEDERINAWLTMGERLVNDANNLFTEASSPLNPALPDNYIVIAPDIKWSEVQLLQGLTSHPAQVIKQYLSVAASAAPIATKAANAKLIAKEARYGTPFNFFVEMRDSSADNNVQNDLFSFFLDTRIVANSSWRLWAANAENGQEVDSPSHPFRFSQDKLLNYVLAFSEEYQRLVTEDKQTLDDEETSIKRELFNSIDADDIKLNLYKNIKSIYDKWIPGSRCELELCGTPAPDSTDDEECTNLIDTFRFIDRAYNDIGDSFLVNPIAMVIEMIEDYNIGMYDYLARTLADNNFDFIPLPTFINYNSEDAVQAAFKPEPFNVSSTASGPQFICMYIGERSKNLNLGTESKHKDDGFQITDDYIGMPEDFTSGSTIIPAFRVAYGDSNQSMFKNFKLDQQEFTETDESLQIIDEIASKGGPNNPSAAGQNLFNVWRTRSYSAVIDSLGNAQIQPFMYFQLDNVPMFAGAYTIIHVKHTIKPNHMSTNFKGVRVRATKTPMIKKSTVFMNLIGSLSEVEFDGVDLGEVSSSNSVDSVNTTGGGGNTTSRKGGKDAPGYAGCIAYAVASNGIGIKVQSTDKLSSGNIVNYTLPEIGKFIESIGEQWYTINKDKANGDTLYYNDFSKEGGGRQAGHASGHRNGLEADIRQVRTDKENSSTEVYAEYKQDSGGNYVPKNGSSTPLNPKYDREATKQLLELILDEALKNPAWKKNKPFKAIWFNDPVLQQYFKTEYKNRDKYRSDGIVRESDGHHHHFHLQFNLPDRIADDEANGFMVCNETIQTRPTDAGSVGHLSTLPEVLVGLGYNKGTMVHQLAMIIAQKEGFGSKDVNARPRRNNNPGNLAGTNFKDIDPNVTLETASSPTFAKFSSVETGTRALVEKKIIQWSNGGYPATKTNGNDTVFQNKYGVPQSVRNIAGKKVPMTIEQFMYTYAPPSENSTNKYITDVVQSLNANGFNVNKDSRIKDYIV